MGGHHAAIWRNTGASSSGIALQQDGDGGEGAKDIQQLLVRGNQPTISVRVRARWNESIALCEAATKPVEKREVLEKLNAEFGSGPLYGRRWNLPIFGAVVVVLGLGG